MWSNKVLIIAGNIRNIPLLSPCVLDTTDKFCDLFFQQGQRHPTAYPQSKWVREDRWIKRREKDWNASDYITLPLHMALRDAKWERRSICRESGGGSGPYVLPWPSAVTPRWHTRGFFLEWVDFVPIFKTKTEGSGPKRSRRLCSDIWVILRGKARLDIIKNKNILFVF